MNNKMFKNFTDYFNVNVKRFPNKLVVITDDEAVTYQELQTQSDHIAAYLQDKELTQEAIIGLICDRSPKMIATMLAVLKVNCAFLPISPLTPIERCRFILENSQAKLVLTDHCRFQEPLRNIEVINIQAALPPPKTPKPQNPKTPYNHISI